MYLCLRVPPSTGSSAMHCFECNSVIRTCHRINFYTEVPTIYTKSLWAAKLHPPEVEAYLVLCGQGLHTRNWKLPVPSLPLRALKIIVLSSWSSTVCFNSFSMKCEDLAGRKQDSFPFMVVRLSPDCLESTRNPNHTTHIQPLVLG